MPKKKVNIPIQSETARMAKKPAPKGVHLPPQVEADAPPYDPDFDTEWFRSRCKSLGISQEKLAEAMGLPTTSVARLLRGKRNLKLKEISTLAWVLQVPPSEVLLRAGFKGELDRPIGGYARGLSATRKIPGGAGATVPLMGWVDDKLRIHEDDIGLEDGSGLPWTGTGKPRAIRFQTYAAASYGPFDGAIAFFETAVAVAGSSIGRISVVGIRDAGMAIRVLARGYTRGRFNLVGMCGELLERDAVVEWASPILSIRFGAVDA